MPKHVLILTDRVGGGEDDLGRLLMRNLVYSMARNEQSPASVTLMNEGVRLACEGSESLDDLRLLIEKGVQVRSCGTCLDYLNLKDDLAAGAIGTMPESVASLLGDEGVLTIC